MNLLPTVVTEPNDKVSVVSDLHPSRNEDPILVALLRNDKSNVSSDAQLSRKRSFTTLILPEDGKCSAVSASHPARKPFPIVVILVALVISIFVSLVQLLRNFFPTVVTESKGKVSVESDLHLERNASPI
eukprot:TRINITY_DN9591_c0_g1_i3.p1 TRINITY_DN9591_c0_g1~~TRINITY_DN9591_c0_g1_i3.p1  ORF type:complete len:130 (-),score=8.90 TRINITY_DN9591_c0_g1_i3:4-393(-)